MRRATRYRAGIRRRGKPYEAHKPSLRRVDPQLYNELRRVRRARRMQTMNEEDVIVWHLAHGRKQTQEIYEYVRKTYPPEEWNRHRKRISKRGFRHKVRRGYVPNSPSRTMWKGEPLLRIEPLQQWLNDWRERTGVPNMELARRLGMNEARIRRLLGARTAEGTPASTVSLDLADRVLMETGGSVIELYDSLV